MQIIYAATSVGLKKVGSIQKAKKVTIRAGNQSDYTIAMPKTNCLNFTI